MKQRTVIIVTGCSGSGRKTALAIFEDAGFFCIDNMPGYLVSDFLSRSVQPSEQEGHIAGWAFGMDLRDEAFLTHFEGLTTDLKHRGYQPVVVFLDADENILLRRYKQTRRHHPLEHGGSLLDAVRAEKLHLKPLYKTADHLIDTSHTSVHELKTAILHIAQRYTAISGMAINVVSFGFKHGTPSEADMIMDVRFLDNPYFVRELRPKDGESKDIQDFVLQDPQTSLFLEKYLDLLDYVIPLYEKEGKAYLTVAIGCTGGRHRSVVVAQKIYAHLQARQPTVRMIHRDIQFE